MVPGRRAGIYKQRHEAMSVLTMTLRTYPWHWSWGRSTELDAMPCERGETLSFVEATGFNEPNGRWPADE